MAERKPAEGPSPERNGKHRLSALDRAIQTAMGDGRVLGREDDPAKDQLPAVWDWLARVYIGTDKVRTPATITIRLGPEGVIATLRDTDLGVSVSASCPHLSGAIQALETALNSEVPPVTSWGKKEPRLRKRSS